MKNVCFLLLAAALMMPEAARANEYTNIHLINSTGHYVYVDAYHLDGLQHLGLKAPGADTYIHIDRNGPIKFFTDVYVYVKKTNTEEASQTLCHVMKPFGNTGKHDMVTEYVRYDGKRCWISPA